MDTKRDPDFARPVVVTHIAIGLLLSAYIALRYSNILFSIQLENDVMRATLAVVSLLASCVGLVALALGQRSVFVWLYTALASVLCVINVLLLL